MGLSFESIPRTSPPHKRTTENIQCVIYFLGVIYCMVFHPHHLIFWMMSVTVLPVFSLLFKSVTHCLRPYRAHKPHTDPQDKLYQQPPASHIKTQKEKEK